MKFILALMALSLATCFGSVQSTTRTLPDLGRPAPVLFPPRLLTEFESQEIVTSAGFIGFDCGISKHSAFATKAADMDKEVYPLARGGNFVEGNTDSIRCRFYCLQRGGHAQIPGRREIREIKDCELYGMTITLFIEPSTAGLNGGAGHLESSICIPNTGSPTGPYFTIERAGWQAALEPFRNIDNISTARPELFSIPERATTVQLLAGEPISHPCGFKVGRQSHLLFIYHNGDYNNNGLIVNT